MAFKSKLIAVAVAAFLIAGYSTAVSKAEQLAGDYIVVFDNQANEHAETAKLKAQGASVNFTYSNAFKGLAGTFNAAQLNALQKNPRVRLIEKDAAVTADTTQSPVPSWGIDRIDQSTTTGSGTYTYTATGSGVTAYVIDTGIYTSHSDFGGRATGGFTAIKDRYGSTDCNGHGTHVAGTIGGTKYGVAKQVSLVAVRVLDCRGSGTNSGVIAGIDWVISNHTTGKAVANMSLGGGASSAVDTAVTNLVNDGVVLAVAAGNSTADACNSSPARAAAAITVGATDSTDTQANYSNYGSCLDVYAPGTGITSAWIKSTTATNTISGTSMATPHVAGVAALYLSSTVIGTENKSVAGATAWITANALSGVVKSMTAGSPNRLLNKQSL